MGRKSCAGIAQGGLKFSSVTEAHKACTLKPSCIQDVPSLLPLDNTGDIIQTAQAVPSLPPLDNTGDIIQTAQDAVSKTAEAGQEAVEGAVAGAKDMADTALDVVEIIDSGSSEGGAGKVNETLDKQGGEVQAKAHRAENKGAAFVEMAKEILPSVVPKRKPAAKKLDDAMPPILEPVDRQTLPAQEALERGRPAPPKAPPAAAKAAAAKAVAAKAALPEAPPKAKSKVVTAVVAAMPKAGKL
ncbi:unnamed protein product [Symbiodinium sp. CCMP2592]|nr:unnamed protein product [Symbiodinium sp. CCMP2592]